LTHPGRQTASAGEKSHAYADPPRDNAIAETQVYLPIQRGNLDPALPDAFRELQSLDTPAAGAAWTRSAAPVT
jgi:hypothetical protein